MQAKATGSPGPNRRALLAIVLVLVILVPVGYSVYARVTTTEPPEFLDPPRGTACVCELIGKDTEWMRYHHWELLRGLREEVVRTGNRSEISFDGCWNCHQSKVDFCDRCHDAAFVRPDCFGCHYYPELGERPPLAARANHE
jgi:hypothetical protein